MGKSTAVDTGSEIHVIPALDRIEHKMGQACTCHPEKENSGKGVVVRHRSMIHGTLCC